MQKQLRIFDYLHFLDMNALAMSEVSDILYPVARKCTIYQIVHKYDLFLSPHIFCHDFLQVQNIQRWKSSSRGYFMMCDFSKNSQFPFTNASIFVSFSDSLLLTSATEILDVKPFMSVTLALNVISCFTANKTLPGMVTCYWYIINHGWEA